MPLTRISSNAPAQEAYTPQTDTGNIDLTSIAQTDIVDASGAAGILSSICMLVNTAIAGSISGVLEIAVDGQSTHSVTLWSTGTAGSGLRAAFIGGTGSSAVSGLQDNHAFRWDFNTRYSNAVRVSLDITAGGSAGNCLMIVTRGIKI